jgi:hypothetical protein
MRQIVKATVIDAQPRWRLEGYGVKVWFGDGRTAEGYVGALDDARKVSKECAARGERYFWEVAQT